MGSEDQHDNGAEDGAGVFGSGTAFADVELSALRAERNLLRAELASRTEAWRVALRELSAAQSELAELRGEMAQGTSTALSPIDWDVIRSQERT